MSTTTTTARDTFGIEIQVGDRVRVTSYGYGARLTDTGAVVTVTGFTRAGNVEHDSDDVANGRAIGPSCLGVLRRDGGLGFEGNRPAPSIRVEKTRDGWKIESPDVLADEEAAAITFRAEPAQVRMGDFVEVVDLDGIRIGHVAKATYQERAFGPAYVVVEIALR